MTTHLAPYPQLTGREPCRRPGTDPEAWFVDNLTMQAAAALCAGCPLRADCLAYAIDHPAQTEYGVWAGTTAGRRRTLRAEFPATTHPTEGPQR